MPMRNALALYLYHLPAADKPRFLGLLFPQIPPSRRRTHLEQDVRPIPAFWDATVQRALKILRPDTHGFAGSILNAADLAVRIWPKQRDAFVRAVLGLAPAATAAPFPTLFDAHRDVLRHMSNEDPRVVRAIEKFPAYDRYHTHQRDPFPRAYYGSDSEYFDEMRRWRHEEDAALLRCPDYASRPRVFQDVEQSTYELRRLLTSGCELNEALTVVVNREHIRGGSPTQNTPLPRVPHPRPIAPLPATVAAVAEVERTRLQNDVRVLHDQRGALHAQLAAKTTVIETLEQERASDRKRIAELEAAQSRTLQAFKELQHAENRRLDAYMGARRTVN